MKRCIVCGNIGSDDSTICSECGNAFVEMDDALESDAPEDSLEKMEEQLKEMWAKVQGEDDSFAAQEAAGEPDLTVISEEPVTIENRAEGNGAASVLDSQRESGHNQETGEAEPVEQKAVPAESSKSADTQKAADIEASKQAAAQKPVDVDTLMKAAAKKTADGEPQMEEPAKKAAPASQSAASGAASSGQQSAQRPAHPRRTKGGPQIYGQEAMAEYSGAQGVIRRDVQGGHTSAGVQTGSGEAGRSGRSASRPPRRTVPTSAEEAVDMQNIQAEATGSSPANAQDTRKNAAKPAPQTQRAAAPPYSQPPMGSQGYGQHGSKPSGTARRIMEAARDALSSPLMILIALFQTVYFVSSVAAIFLRQLNYEQGAKLLALLPLPSQISGYTTMLQAAMAQLDSGALILNLVIRVPDLLLCIALWVLCITVRNAGEKMSGVGFLFMRIAVILNMIAACAALLVVLVVFVVFVIAAWNSGTTSLITLAVAALVLAIVVTMAVLMYFFCYLATIKTVRKNAVSGERYGSVSTYVAVVKMVVALTAIISILSGIVNLEITGITTGAGQLGWMILFGIWILKYKSTLSEYED